MMAKKIELQTFYLIPAEIDILVDPITEGLGQVICLGMESRQEAIVYAEAIAAHTKTNWRLYGPDHRPIKSLLFGRSTGVKKVYLVDPDVEGIAKTFYY